MIYIGTVENHFYKIAFALAAASQQPGLIDFFRVSGGESIQTSDGICAKTTLSEAELRTRLAEKDLGEGLNISRIDSSTADLSPDVKSFLAGYAGP